MAIFEGRGTLFSIRRFPPTAITKLASAGAHRTYLESLRRFRWADQRAGRERPSVPIRGGALSDDLHASSPSKSNGTQGENHDVFRMTPSSSPSTITCSSPPTSGQIGCHTFREASPHIVETEAGDPLWCFEGEIRPQVIFGAVAGTDPRDWSCKPVRYQDIRLGFYEPRLGSRTSIFRHVRGSFAFLRSPDSRAQSFFKPKTRISRCTVSWPTTTSSSMSGAPPRRAGCFRCALSRSGTSN